METGRTSRARSRVPNSSQPWATSVNNMHSVFLHACVRASVVDFCLCALQFVCVCRVHGGVCVCMWRCVHVVVIFLFFCRYLTEARRDGHNLRKVPVSFLACNIVNFLFLTFFLSRVFRDTMEDQLHFFCVFHCEKLMKCWHNRQNRWSIVQPHGPIRAKVQPHPHERHLCLEPTFRCPSPNCQVPSHLAHYGIWLVVRTCDIGCGGQQVRP